MEEQDKIERTEVDREADAYLIQQLNPNDPSKVWEHSWRVPKWGEGNPTYLDGRTIEIRGKPEPSLGTYRVVPFYSRQLPKEWTEIDSEALTEIIAKLRAFGENKLADYLTGTILLKIKEA